MIKHTPPPNYNEIKKHFPSADFNNGTVFTYFPDIYIRSHPQSHLLVHENTHLRQQQRISPVVWWEKYFSDMYFRLSQEVEAYHNQYLYNKEILNEIARDLSSPLYGSICTYKQALALIKNGQ